MSKIINITVRDKISTNLRQNEAEYVCGNSDFVILFDFDEEWSAYDTKTARFKYNGTFQDIVFTGNECSIPVIEDAYNIQVGVFAGNLHTTTPAFISAKKSILCGSGSPAEPAPDVYAQIMELIQGLGDVDPEVIAAAVTEYMEQHPYVESDPTVPDWAKSEKKPTYTADEVGALPSNTKIPSKTSELQNDSGFMTGYTETDPTVPKWAKNPQKPSYTAQEVGALPDTTSIPSALSDLSDDETHRVVTDAEKAAWNEKSNFSGSYNDLTDKPTIPDVPVQSVNGKTGAVVLSAEDVGALPGSTVIPEAYTLPIASSTVLGGVKPVAKTDAMTQSVGVDDAGALWAPPGSGGGGGESAFELIDTIDWSTEEMAVEGAGKEYVLDGVTEIVFVCTALENVTTTLSSLMVNCNGAELVGNFLPASGKSGTPANGFVWYKLFDNVGLIAFRPSTFNISNTNYVGVSLNSPYNIFPFDSKIYKLKVVNRHTYVTNSGTLKIYVR